MVIGLSKSDFILVTGGHGFIGSHVSLALHKQGYRVRIVDIVESSPFNEPICSEFQHGNLCDADFCKIALAGITIVLHFAANMGGMGTIHSANDFEIYTENHAMTLNLLSSAVFAGARKFLYASSACVYPQSLQGHDEKDVSLRETDVWNAAPPLPQHLYGSEKLNSELILKQFEGRIQIHVARFHNVYGARGSWKNGREKAPAAMIRKAFAAAFSKDHTPEFEIWGTGDQRRSFLYISDCVRAVMMLLNSDCHTPVNIGSDRSVSIRELAEIALRCAGLQPNAVRFQFAESKPIGVGSRNSNNELVTQVLGWRPETSLEDGMKETGAWIKEEMVQMLGGVDDAQRLSILRGLRESITINLSSEVIRFAILLPITSRGLAGPEQCLLNLGFFAESLKRTTWRNTHALGGTRYRTTIYLSIDHDDDYLLDGSKVKAVLHARGISDVIVSTASYEKGDVCSHWRACAKRAWEDGCDYFTLMGDDVLLQDEGWMEDVHAEFSTLAQKENVPHGVGCVAFTDTSFPGMPTFPVVHRSHMDIFNGRVVPDLFFNQDGDPFLFQLYRRWGCSSMIPARITNRLGGSADARYEKRQAVDWTFETLDEATTTVELWQAERSPATEKKLTVDIMIPCYRVLIPYMDAILNLQPSPTCSVMFIIIVDNPKSSSTQILEQKYGHRPDVRIRINKENLGASASRNRGMRESSAEWIHFLDDDVTPRDDLLIELEKVIRKHPNAAGFIGNSVLPPADNIFTAAVHLAGVTYFWDIATKIKEDLPWGVTANLVARRNVKDGVTFDLRFPKTGGGEDIDFCRKKREFSVNNGREGFWPAPDVVITHPWWYGGKRTYWRFYLWAKGDGALIKMYPQFQYWDAAPNSAELLLGCAAVLAAGLFLLPLAHEAAISMLLLGFKASLAVFLANFAHDFYRHLWRDIERVKAMRTSVSGGKWFVAIAEGSLIRMTSEMGRAVGLLCRGEIRYLGKRFDWFTDRVGPGPRQEERKNVLQKLALLIVFLSMSMM